MGAALGLGLRPGVLAATARLLGSTLDELSDLALGYLFRPPVTLLRVVRKWLLSY